MRNEILTFGNIEIEKHKFYRHKSPVSLSDVDIEKVLTRFLLVKNTISILVVTCIMTIKLSNYR